jgi:alkylation response protein AidB-like acyl-CoA dehydrogenase
MMDLSLSDEQALIRETFAEFLRRECGAAVVRAAEPTGFDAKLWEAFAGLGALGTGVAEARGGAGGGLLELCLVAEEVGARVAPLPFAETAVAARLLSELDAPEAPPLDALLAGAPLATLALFDAESEPVQLVPAGAVAELALAASGDAVLALARPEGARPAANLACAPLARWRVADARPRVLARGAAARAVFARALDAWRAVTAASLVGVARGALELGIAYAKEREQFGVPIGSFQAISHPLADAATWLDGARLLVHEAAWAEREEPRRAPELCSMAFAYAAEIAPRIAELCLHVHGGYGVSNEYDVQLHYRRARGWALVGGGASGELRRLGELQRDAADGGR